MVSTMFNSTHKLALPWPRLYTLMETRAGDIASLIYHTFSMTRAFLNCPDYTVSVRVQPAWKNADK